MSPLCIFNKKMKEEKMKTQVLFFVLGFFFFEATAAAGRELTTEQALSLVEQGKMLSTAGSLPWPE